MLNNQFDEPFTSLGTESQTRPFVLNSPHSGNFYPDNFLESSALNHHSIRSSEDFLVDELVQEATELGIPLLKANFPRAYLDVNREPYELDQNMFEEELPPFVNTRSIRVTSGLGTIARLVAEGTEIYNRKLSVVEGLGRVETLYKPYHATLQELLETTHGTYGCAVLVDCHSMPSGSPKLSREHKADIVLGDRFGTSCAPAITHYARSILRNMGYYVELNKPYAGGFITENYGQPQNGFHALQLEINRGLYMNDILMKKGPGFEALREDLTEFFNHLSSISIEDLTGTTPLAAE